MSFSRSLSKFLGLFLFICSSISHARYGLGLWVLGGADVGGGFLTSTVVNPAGGVNAKLQEQAKSGLLYNAKAGLSWYVSSVFAIDVLGGWSGLNMVGKVPQGGKALEIHRNLAIAEFFPRVRFGDLGRWQLGPLYRKYFGSNTGFSENPGLSHSNNSASDFLGLGFNYDIRSATERTLYRVGFQALTDMSDPRSIYLGALSFQIGFDLFGSEDDSMYLMRPELYPGEEESPLPAIRRLPVVENDFSVEESEPLPLRNRFFEMPVEKSPVPEPSMFQSVEEQPMEQLTQAAKLPDASVQEAASAVVIRLPSDNFQFASGMSHIGSSKSKDYLQALGAFLSDNNQSFRKLAIVGHTDKRGPQGRERQVNMELSRARAKSVYDALVTGGADSEKLRYEGRAFDEPVDGAPDNSKGWKLNRRVEISLEEVSDPDSLVQAINQLNQKFGIKEKATIKQ